MRILTPNYDKLSLRLYLTDDVSNVFYDFRSRPVINLEAELSFVTEAGKIDMGDKECVISSGESVACLPIKTCFKYTGIGVESYNGLMTRIFTRTWAWLTSSCLTRRVWT